MRLHQRTRAYRTESIAGRRSGAESRQAATRLEGTSGNLTYRHRNKCRCNQHKRPTPSGNVMTRWRQASLNKAPRPCPSGPRTLQCLRRTTKYLARALLGRNNGRAKTTHYQIKRLSFKGLAETVFSGDVSISFRSHARRLKAAAFSLCAIRLFRCW